MALIKAPNKSYAGISAGVAFSNGEGHTDNPDLVEWFRCHGYAVEDENAKPKRSGKSRKGE